MISSGLGPPEWLNVPWLDVFLAIRIILGAKRRNFLGTSGLYRVGVSSPFSPRELGYVARRTANLIDVGVHERLWFLLEA